MGTDLPSLSYHASDSATDELVRELTAPRAATALQQQIGSRPVLRLASDAGLRDMPDVPSLSLGTGLVTPLELTAAFAMFPNGGFAVQPRGISRVIDADGTTAYDNPAHATRVISPQVAYQMVSMLGDVLDRGTGSQARSLGVRFPAGGKTGTTFQSCR